MALVSIPINHHAGTPKHNNYKRHDKLGYSPICYIGSKIGWVSMKEVLIHTFSVLSLQLKKLRLHNKSAIDLSNAIPACGHKEVPRSTGHIMVTTRYSGQQGSNRDKKLFGSTTSNGTDQYQNDSSNLLTPYRKEPRSTRIVVAYPRPAFSATKRTNNAPISFDQQVQVCRGHIVQK